MTRMTLILMASSLGPAWGVGVVVARWFWGGRFGVGGGEPVAFELLVVFLVGGGGFLEFAGMGQAALLQKGGKGEHGDREEEIESDDFDEHGPDGFFCGARDGLNHDAGHVGDGFNAREGEDDVDEGGPFV